MSDSQFLTTLQEQVKNGKSIVICVFGGIVKRLLEK